MATAGDPGRIAADVMARLTELEAACRTAGLVAGERRALQYGGQISVRQGSATATLTVYGGKKGISVVVGGAPVSALRTTLEALAGGAKGAVTPHAAPPAGALFPAGPWIGSDESGKGDYFGPLVAAAVFVEPAQEAALRAAGVRDSKLLDDAAARRSADAVRTICAGRFAEDLLEPASYNARYAALRARGENLNHLLADSHVRVIAAVLASLPADAPAPLVIADQFANERHVRERLLARTAAEGRAMPPLLQAPRAEANVAVAAASILARDRFLAWLDEASARGGVRLPKGGSNAAIVAAARRIAASGEGALAQVAKLHFATTQRVT
jgi:ribonuclease HIII